eukprot:365126-Chlamydomonas_euryale.AAC.16
MAIQVDRFFLHIRCVCLNSEQVTGAQQQPTYCVTGWLGVGVQPFGRPVSAAGSRLFCSALSDIRTQPQARACSRAACRSRLYG